MSCSFSDAVTKLLSIVSLQKELPIAQMDTQVHAQIQNLFLQRTQQQQHQQQSLQNSSSTAFTAYDGSLQHQLQQLLLQQRRRDSAVAAESGTNLEVLGQQQAYLRESDFSSYEQEERTSSARERKHGRNEGGKNPSKKIKKSRRQKGT